MTKPTAIRLAENVKTYSSVAVTVAAATVEAMAQEARDAARTIKELGDCIDGQCDAMGALERKLADTSRDVETAERIATELRKELAAERDETGKWWKAAVQSRTELAALGKLESAPTAAVIHNHYYNEPLVSGCDATANIYCSDDKGWVKGKGRT